jgi:hypothetical protein
LEWFLPYVTYVMMEIPYSILKKIRDGLGIRNRRLTICSSWLAWRTSGNVGLISQLVTKIGRELRHPRRGASGKGFSNGAMQVLVAALTKTGVSWHATASLSLLDQIWSPSNR